MSWLSPVFKKEFPEHLQGFKIEQDQKKVETEWGVSKIIIISAAALEMTGAIYSFLHRSYWIAGGLGATSFLSLFGFYVGSKILKNYSEPYEGSPLFDAKV